MLGPRWAWVSRVEESKEEARVHQFLDRQSAWYLDFIEANAEMSDLELLQAIGQQFHYFANMAQMRIL